VLESILRGAMGRISAYQRVHLHSTCSSAGRYMIMWTGRV
jgi:hypothetical protein